MAKSKNQSKLGKVAGWLNPTSPKKGMLSFALAFALIGGGYMLYSSFAATSVPVLFDASTLISEAPYSLSSSIVTKAPGDANRTNIAGPSTSHRINGSSYSPNYKYIAWIDVTNSNLAGTIKVKDRTTGTVTTFTVPTDESITNLVPLKWGAGGGRIMFVAYKKADFNSSILRTVNVDPTTGAMSNMKTIYSKSGVTISSADISGDGKYVVFAADAIYSLPIGGLPPTVLTSAYTEGFCGTVRRRPHTDEEFTYSCGNKTTETIYRRVLGQPEQTIYSSTIPANASNQTVNVLDGEYAWSHDGSKVAFKYTSVAYSSTTDCSGITSTTSKWAKVNYDGTAMLTLASGKPSASTICHGGGGSDSSTIAWSPDNSQIAFLRDDSVCPECATNQYIYVTSSTTAGTTTQLTTAKDAWSVDW